MPIKIRLRSKGGKQPVTVKAAWIVGTLSVAAAFTSAVVANELGGSRPVIINQNRNSTLPQYTPSASPVDSFPARPVFCSRTEGRAPSVGKLRLAHAPFLANVYHETHLDADALGDTAFTSVI